MYTTRTLRTNHLSNYLPIFTYQGFHNTHFLFSCWLRVMRCLRYRTYCHFKLKRCAVIFSIGPGILQCAPTAIARALILDALLRRYRD